MKERISQRLRNDGGGFGVSATALQAANRIEELEMEVEVIRTALAKLCERHRKLLFAVSNALEEDRVL